MNNSERVIASTNLVQTGVVRCQINNVHTNRLTDTQLSRLHVRHYNSTLSGARSDRRGYPRPLLLNKDGSFKPNSYREMSTILRFLGRSVLKVRTWLFFGTGAGGYAASQVSLNFLCSIYNQLY